MERPITKWSKLILETQPHGKGKEKLNHLWGLYSKTIYVIKKNGKWKHYKKFERSFEELCEDYFMMRRD